jgi:hypothetical protein
LANFEADLKKNAFFGPGPMRDVYLDSAHTYLGLSSIKSNGFFTKTKEASFIYSNLDTKGIPVR